MAYADWNFYKDEYLGIVIESQDEYAYFAERASDELARYAKCIPDADEAICALKRCACRIADIIYGDFKSSKYGQKITSESVSGYYSVGYSANDFATIRRLINNAIKLYLGRYVLKAVKNIII